jgi:hypothetical protein
MDNLEDVPGLLGGARNLYLLKLPSRLCRPPKSSSIGAGDAYPSVEGPHPEPHHSPLFSLEVKNV